MKIISFVHLFTKYLLSTLPRTTIAFEDQRVTQEKWDLHLHAAYILVGKGIKHIHKINKYDKQRLEVSIKGTTRNIW